MKTPARAPLLAIEGIDGAGKTTLQRALAHAWRERGVHVLELREPSRGPAGRRARRTAGRDPWTAAMAFTDDRRSQRPRLERALRSGTVVLLDRSFYSTLAYQGSALPLVRRRELERFQGEATVIPDRVILLRLPLAVSEARMRRRGITREPTEHRAVLARAARSYRELSRRPGWIVLDARQPPAQLLAQLNDRLTSWVVRRAGTARRRA